MRPEAEGERISFSLEVDYFPGWTHTVNKVEAMLTRGDTEQLILAPNITVLLRKVDEILSGKTLL